MGGAVFFGIKNGHIILHQTWIHTRSMQWALCMHDFLSQQINICLSNNKNWRKKSLRGKILILEGLQIYDGRDHHIRFLQETRSKNNTKDGWSGQWTQLNPVSLLPMKKKHTCVLCIWRQKLVLHQPLEDYTLFFKNTTESGFIS